MGSEDTKIIRLKDDDDLFKFSPTIDALPIDIQLRRPCLGDDGGLAPELVSLWMRTSRGVNRGLLLHRVFVAWRSMTKEKRKQKTDNLLNGYENVTLKNLLFGSSMIGTEYIPISN